MDSIFAFSEELAVGFINEIPFDGAFVCISDISVEAVVAVSVAVDGVATD